MPTPTPVPVGQIAQTVQQLNQTAYNAVQQGAVGIVLLLAVALVLFVLFMILRTYVNRNHTDETDGTNNAISALARMSDNRDKEAAIEREERRKEQEQWRQLIEQRDQQSDRQYEKFIEAVSHMSDAHFKIADTLKLMREKDLIATQGMEQSLTQMATIGSIPLQGLIQTAAQIKVIVDEIRLNILPTAEIMNMRQIDRELFQRQLENVRDEVKTVKTTLQEQIDKLKTSEIPAVPPDLPPN